MLSKFWSWYEKYYTLNLTLATVIFSWQIIHLIWLFTHVIWARLFGYSLWRPDLFWEQIIIYVDYTEIPAIVSVSLVYVNDLRKKFNRKEALLLIFLLSQVFHIFWISDEYVADKLLGDAIVGIPSGLAWIAILIDYLEVPVMVDTFRKLKAKLAVKVG